MYTLAFIKDDRIIMFQHHAYVTIAMMRKMTCLEGTWTLTYTQE